MYVPAYETEAMAFKETAMQMTASPPAYEAGKVEPGVKRYPVTLTSDQLHAHRRVPVRHRRGGEAGRPPEAETTG